MGGKVDLLIRYEMLPTILPFLTQTFIYRKVLSKNIDLYRKKKTSVTPPKIKGLTDQISHNLLMCSSLIQKIVIKGNCPFYAITNANEIVIMANHN